MGGVNLENAKDFITAGAVGVGIGCSLAKKEWIENAEYEKIAKVAKQLIESLSTN